MCGESEIQVNAVGSGTASYTAFDMVVLGDIGRLVSWKPESEPEHDWFHVLMGVHDYTQRTYALTKFPQCFTIKLYTLHDNTAESSGRFDLKGYGDVPSACKQTKGAYCLLTVCEGTSLELTALGTTEDGRRFDLSGM